MTCPSFLYFLLHSETKTLQECYTNAKGENGVGEYQEVKEIPSSEEHLLDFNMVSNCSSFCSCAT